MHNKLRANLPEDKNGPIIILINSATPPKPVLAFLHNMAVKNHLEQVVFVLTAPDISWEQRLSKLGFPCYLANELLAAPDVRVAEARAEDWQRNWYRQQGCDFTRFEFLSLGAVSEIGLYFAFRDLLLAAALLRVILDKFNPVGLVIPIGLREDYRQLARQIHDPSIEYTEGSQVWETIQKGAKKFKSELGKIVKRGEIRYRLDRVWRLVKDRRYLRSDGDGSRHLLAVMEIPRTHIFEMFSPVLNEMKLRGWEEILVTPTFSFWDVLRRKGLYCRVTEEFSTPLSRQWAKRATRTLRKAWELVRVQAEFRRQFAYAGFDLSQIVLSQLDHFFEYQGPWLLEKTTQFQQLIQQLQIEVVLLASDIHPLSRLACIVCRELSCPTVYMLHGFPFDKNAVTPLFADYLAVWDQSTYDWFIRHGVAESSMVITGSPRHDRLFCISYEEAWKYCANHLGFDGDKKNMILVATDPSEYTVNKQLVDSAIELARAHPESVVVIKLHPNEQNEWQQELLTSARQSNLFLVRDFDIKYLLRAARVVVNGISTVGIEAALIGKPVVTCVMEGDRLGLEMPSLGPRVTNTIDIVQAVEAILLIGPDPETTPHGFVNEKGAMGGTATRRVADLLTSVARNDRKKHVQLS